MSAHRVIFEEADNENNYIEGSFIVTKESALGLVKDCGLYFQNVLEQLSAPVQKGVWRDVAKFMLSVVIGIEQQNDASSGYKVPPVLPHELVKIRSYEFNAIVSEQTR